VVDRLTEEITGTGGPAGAGHVMRAGVPAELSWRPVGEQDIPAIVGLLAAVEEVDRTGEHLDAADVADDLQQAGFDPERHTIGVFEPDGGLVGFGRVNVPRAVRDVDRVGLAGAVHPAWRGTGIGRRLLVWLELRGEAEHRLRHPTVPGQLQLSPCAHVASHVRLAERAGYTAVRWFNEMRRDLAEPIPQPPPVGGAVRVVPFDWSFDEAVRHAHNEAFARHWGSVDRDEVAWRQWFTGSRAFRPELSFVVLDGAEHPAGPVVAAYLLSYFWAADAEATGEREAWIGQLGTRAPWRGRGLGAALIRHALLAYREAGYLRAALGVDTENVTGALRLYQRHGFTVEVCRVGYVKTLG
jgi:mycothiol synthase